MRVAVNGIEIYYEEQGQGTPLLLIHGIGSSTESWVPVVPALATSFRVLTLDVRGFGRSSKPHGPYSAELWARDISALLDATSIKHAVIIGHSMGGVVAQRFALDFSQRLSALILESTSSQVNERATRFWTEQADQIESDGFGAWVERQQASYTAQFLRQNPSQLAEDRRRVAMNESHAYAAGARAVAAYNFTPELSRITAPTMILQGLTDVRTPPGGSVIMNRTIPDSRLIMLEDTGHTIHAERPTRFVSLVREFLGHLERTCGPLASGPASRAAG